MTLRDVVRLLSLRDLTGSPELLEVEVTCGYASDLLSDILANAPEGGLSLTIQAHMSALAVAVHSRQAALLFTSSRIPPDDVVARALANGVALLATDLCTFDAAGRLYQLGLRGRPDASAPHGLVEEVRRA
jgi:hypothetical protein